MSEYSFKKIQLQKLQDSIKSQTLLEMGEKYARIRGVIDGSSQTQLNEKPYKERFGDLYSEFQFYSRGQLQHLEKTFLSADLDHDCKLSHIELMYWMEKQGFPINKGELRSIFAEADNDRDSFLSFREFVYLCRKIEQSNTQNQSRSFSSQVIQPDLKDCICNSVTASGNNNEDSRSVLQPGSSKIQNGLSKFSEAIKPGITESGRVNIQQAVKYFEREIERVRPTNSRSRQGIRSTMSSTSKNSRLSINEIDETSFTHENVPAIRYRNNIISSKLNSGNLIVRETNSKLYMKPNTTNEPFNKLVDKWEKASNRALHGANSFSKRTMMDISRSKLDVSNSSHISIATIHLRKSGHNLLKANSSQVISNKVSRLDLDSDSDLQEAKSSESLIVKMINSVESMSKTSVNEDDADDDDEQEDDEDNDS